MRKPSAETQLRTTNRLLKQTKALLDLSRNQVAAISARANKAEQEIAAYKHDVRARLDAIGIAISGNEYFQRVEKLRGGDSQGG